MPCIKFKISSILFKLLITASICNLHCIIQCGGYLLQFPPKPQVLYLKGYTIAFLTKSLSPKTPGFVFKGLYYSISYQIASRSFSIQKIFKIFACGGHLLDHETRNFPVKPIFFIHLKLSLILTFITKSLLGHFEYINLQNFRRRRAFTGS